MDPDQLLMLDHDREKRELSGAIEKANVIYLGSTEEIMAAHPDHRPDQDIQIVFLRKRESSRYN
jgi:hypothetical protein